MRAPALLPIGYASMNTRLEFLIDHVWQNATLTPDREALVLEDVRLTWRETADLVNGCAMAMLASGVVRGARIAMLSTPRPEYVVVMMAALKVGAIWLGLNPRHTARELRFIIGDSKPMLVFSLGLRDGRNYLDDLDEIRSEAGPFQLVALTGERGSAELTMEEFLQRRKNVTPGELDARAAANRPGDPAVIVYTSGTTGEPKGALLSQAGFLDSYRVQAALWKAEPLRIINNMPISHIGGIGDITAYATISGGTMVFMERFDPVRLLDTVNKERISVLGQVTAMYQKIVDCEAWRSADLSSLQLLWWAGSEAPLSLVEELGKRVQKTVTYYGMTELTGSVSYVNNDQPLEVKARTIGHPRPEFELRLANDAGEPAMPGASGEIQARGKNVFLGYWNRELETKTAFTGDGWFKTGDIGRIREDGNWEVVGRLKEMFKSGGYNVYPREIEQVIESHPDVESACLLALPDPQWQEIGWAFVRPKSAGGLDTVAMASFLRQQLAGYKLPKRIILVAEWPVTASGKIDKAALRDQAESLRLH